MKSRSFTFSPNALAKVNKNVGYGSGLCATIRLQEVSLRCLVQNASA